MRRRAALLTAAALMLSSRAAAEPYEPKPGEILHLRTPTTGQTDGGTELRLPPGYFLDERTWEITDVEMRRLQEREIRLEAENASLRRSADTMSFGWYVVTSAVLAGFAAGYLLAQ